MNRAFQKSLCCAAVLVVICGGLLRAQSSGTGFILIPFKDESGFDGGWDIRMEVPRYLAAYLKARYGTAVVSPMVVANRLSQENLPTGALEDVRFWKILRDELHLRFLIHGTVNEFDVGRFNTGAPELGGYESYKGTIRVTYTLIDLDRLESSVHVAERFSGVADGEFADRSMALTLFAKPTQRTVEFRDIGRIRFGSEEFTATVIGQACRQMADKFAGDLEQALPILRSRDLLLADTVSLGPEPVDSTTIVFRGRIVQGNIVFLEGDDAFLTIGSDDGVQGKQIVSVYSDTVRTSTNVVPRKVGTIELFEIRGPHLSLGKIKTGKEFIRTKQIVRVRVLE